VDIPGVSDAVLQRHLEMLMEGGLIEAQPVGSYNLSRYLAEWDYKWNTRKMTDGERAALIARATEGKRLTYRPTHEAADH
jgi:DNA-binding transcriptional ArsR family regulator